MTTRDEKTVNLPKAQPAQQGKAPIPPEIKQLADLVILLNILKKNLAIYPSGHHLISQSTDAAIEALGKCFMVSPVVTIGAVKDSLYVGGRRIEGKSTVFRDFALSLTRLGITSLSLARGLDQEELLRLQRLLSLRPEDVLAKGGIASLTEAAELPNVKIKLVDYSMFRSSEEAVIKGPSEHRPVEQFMAGVDIWEQFTKGLRAGRRTGGGGPAPGGRAEGGAGRRSTGDSRGGSSWDSRGGIDGGNVLGNQGGGDGVLEAGTELHEDAEEEELSPGMIVRMLNDGTLPVEQAVQSYADVLAQFAGMGFQRHMMGKEALRFFDRMNIILHNLKGGIRNRFLKTAFTHMSMLSGEDAMEELLQCFPADLAAEMMGVADHEGQSLSPSLQKLMLKFSAVHDSMTDQEAMASEPPSGAAMPFMDALQILPKRENYEKHMTSDYIEQLDTMGKDPQAIKPPPEFSLDEHLQSLGKQSLDMHIGRVLIALMDQDIEPAAYHDFTQKVIELVPELLDAGSFRPMFVIFSTLRQHIATKEHADIRALAKMALQIFFEPAFVMQMVAQLAEAGDDASSDLLDMLRETGQQAIPELLDLYANNQSSEGNRRLFELLCSFGSPVVDVALTRLYNRSFSYVRNLLQFIKAAGDASVVPHVRPLLKHNDRDLRHEALEVLLTFKDQSAAAALRQQLRSQSMGEIVQAVQMIHEHRVVGLGAELLRLIKIFIPFESDTVLNCMVLHALGAVSDPAILESLKKIAQARLTLFPGNLRKTKRALFESLHSYPQASARELMDIGLRSGDEQIRKICRGSTSNT
jgi:HEAT repeat protein